MMPYCATNSGCTCWDSSQTQQTIVSAANTEVLCKWAANKWWELAVTWLLNFLSCSKRSTVSDLLYFPHICDQFKFQSSNNMYQACTVILCELCSSIPGDPQTFTVSVTPQRNLPLDFYILIDLSGSMENELNTVKSISSRIGKPLQSPVQCISSRIGKPYSPLSNVSPLE